MLSNETNFLLFTQSNIEAAWDLVDPAQKKLLTIGRFRSACVRLLKKANLDQPTVQIKACGDKDGKTMAHAALVQGNKRYRMGLNLVWQDSSWKVHLGNEFFTK